MTKDDSGSGEDFGALLDEFERGKDKAAGGRGRNRGPAVGDLVKGRVESIGREVVFLTLADGTTEGVIGIEELRQQGGKDDGKLTVAVGDTLEARVVELGDKAGHVVLKKVLRKGGELRGELQQAFELGIPVEGTVSAVNKGGVDVMIAGVRAFCPISQLDLRPVEDAGSFIGKTFAFRITKHEADRRGVNLVVSRRAILEEEQKALAAVTREKLIVGAVLPGVVTAIKDFGAFVDLGGIEGMLHVSELGFSRGQRPGEVLSLGQPLEVQVLRIEKTTDPKRPERISLSLKSLSRDPWEDVPTKYAPGTKLNGKVARAEAFGAFVELEPGVEGLVHISELGAERGGHSLRHAREAVKPGDTIEVTVLALDRERRRISLGKGDRRDEIEPADLAAAARVAAPGKLGTLGDLLKARTRS
jgi:small subunit ribosomal protein S1